MAKKQFIFICLIQLSTLFSQFNNVTSSYEHSNLIKDEHKYILDIFNEKVKNYFEYNTFANEYDFLDLSIHINIIFPASSLCYWEIRQKLQKSKRSRTTVFAQYLWSLTNFNFRSGLLDLFRYRICYKRHESICPTPPLQGSPLCPSPRWTHLLWGPCKCREWNANRVAENSEINLQALGHSRTPVQSLECPPGVHSCRAQRLRFKFF